MTAGDPTPRAVGALLRQKAAELPDAPFVRCGGDWLSRAELDEASDRLAAGLSLLGVARGDRVATILPNRVEAIEIFFALAKLGAIEVPLNQFLKGDFLRHQLADCSASVLVTDHDGLRSADGLLESTTVKHVVLVGDEATDPTSTVIAYSTLASESSLPPAIEVRASDPVAIMYTSGTTGLPKGCVLPHGYYIAVPETLRELGWNAVGDRAFTAFPLFHMSGIHLLLGALVNDGSVHFEPAFHAQNFMERAREAGATLLSGVGAMGMAILAQPPTPADAGSDLRLAIWLPMAPDAQLAFEERFGVGVISEGWSQTECMTVTLNAVDGPRQRHSCGRPTPRYEVRLFDDDDNEVPVGEVGEIVVRPREPNTMFLGYWENPEATVRAFTNLWHHSGDFARMDEEGFLTFVDRKKDALRRRGENVSSFELEAAIGQHPAIAQVAVSAVPSPMGDDDIKASVVLVPGADLTAEDLFGFCKDRLPYFAIPRFVDRRESLPMNALNRVMKHKLREEGVHPDMWDLESLGLVVEREERRG